MDESVDLEKSECHRIKKHVREFEIIASDRVKMIDSANDFVGHMVNKQILPSMMSSMKIDEPLSESENSAYRAALGFLERQFLIGYREAEIFDKRNEVESDDQKTA